MPPAPATHPSDTSSPSPSDPPRPPSLAKAALLIARADLARRIRNRSAIITGVVAPLVVAIVFSALLGGATEAGTFRVGLVAPAGSAQATAVVAALTEAPADGGGAERSPVRFRPSDSRAAARRAVDDGRLDVAIVFPSEFDGVTSGGTATIEVLRSPDREISAQVGESIAAGIARSYNLTAAAIGLDVEVGGEAPTDATVAAAAALRPALAVASQSSKVRELSGGAFFAASMAMLFLFFSVGFAAQSIIAERADGTLARVLAAPIPPRAVIIGKCASVMVMGVGSYLVIWGVTTVILDADWGNPAGVAVIIAATVFALGGVAIFASSLARTDQQAQTLTAVVAFALALLGGNFVGPSGMTPSLATLSLLTPNGWALNTFVDLSSGAATVQSVATAAGVLVAMGLVFGALGLRRIHRLLVP